MSGRQSGVVRLRANRDWMWLWVGNTASSLAGSLAGFALPLIVLGVTGSVRRAGLVAAVAGVCSFMLALPAGAVVDRVSRRTVIRTASIVSAVVFAVAAVAVLPFAAPRDWWVLIVAAAADAVLGCFTGPAGDAAIRSVVDRGDLAAARSINQARTGAVRLVAAPLGGVLLAAGHALPLLVAAAAAGVEAVTISRVHHDLPAPTHDEGRGPALRQRRGTRLTTDIRSGLVLVWRRPFYRAFVLFAAVSNTGSAMYLLVVNLVLATRGVPTGVIGLVDTAAAAATITGAAIGPWLVARARPVTLLAVSSTAMVLAYGGLALLPLVPWVWVLVPAGRLLLPAANASVGAYLMGVVPDHAQGRMSATIAFGATALQPLAPAAGTLLLATTGPRTTLVVATLVLTAGAAQLALNPELRHAPAPGH